MIDDSDKLKPCPSCGGDCGRTNLTGCQYQGRARNILATGEMEDIRAILKKWGYNTVEACIESYLLGINRRRKANFDLSDESISLAVGLIRAGMTVNDAAARLGITPNNIYRCPEYKLLLAERQQILLETLK
jgi:hypothetical protein